MKSKLFLLLHILPALASAILLSCSGLTNDALNGPRGRGPVYSVSGTVLDANAGLAGATIVIENKTSKKTLKTDSSGKFLFTNITPGIYTVHAETNGKAFAPLSRQVIVDYDDITDVEFSACVAYKVSGVLSGVKVVVANMKIKITGEAGSFTTYTNFSGLFEFLNVPAGSYVISHEKEDLFCPRTRYVVVEDRDVTGINFLAGSGMWEKNFGKNLNDEMNAVIQTSDGGVAAVGFSSSKERKKDFYLVKTDGGGNMIWEQRYGGFNDDIAVDVVELADGSLMIAGETNSFGEAGSNFMLMKVDYWGNHLWNKTYGGAGCESPRALIAASDGGFIISGYMFEAGSSSKKGWAVKVDGEGEKIWSKDYGYSGGDDIFACVESTDGNYVFAGSSISYANSTSKAWIFKVESETGYIIWNTTFGGLGSETAHGLVADGDDFVFTGTTTSETYGLNDMYVVKISGEGELIWSNHFGTANDEIAHSIARGSDGTFLIAGSRTDAFGNMNGTIVKIDNGGNLEWQNAFGSAERGERITRALFSGDGIITAGSADTANNRVDGWVMRLNSDGSK